MARILVVNDTQEILEPFRQLLEGEGHEVVLSGFPIQQIEDVERVSPDLIILDFVINDQKSGWQMLQMLKMKKSTVMEPLLTRKLTKEKRSKLYEVTVYEVLINDKCLKT